MACLLCCCMIFGSVPQTAAAGMFTEEQVQENSGTTDYGEAAGENSGSREEASDNGDVSGAEDAGGAEDADGSEDASGAEDAGGNEDASGAENADGRENAGDENNSADEKEGSGAEEADDAEDADSTENVGDQESGNDENADTAEDAVNAEDAHEKEFVSGAKAAGEKAGADGVEEKLEELPLRSVQARTGSGTGELLDGDYAYISEAGLLQDATADSGYAIRTGTAPWDDEAERDIAGNDVTDLDNVVRTFDVVSYTTYFRSSVREDAPYAFYKSGTLHFEFILPGSEDQVRFETESMGWLSAKKDAKYTIFEDDYEGEACQVLRGSYLWEPNEDNPAAIGESYQELTVVLRVLAMQNEAKIQPVFTFWLEGNEVPDTGLVTGESLECSEHDDVEAVSVKPPEITVTAAPRYNIQLKGCDSRTPYLGYFDFSTGNDQAANKNAGLVYGRANAVGITIQIVGKTPQLGLRGCELPAGDIAFEVELSSAYRGTNGKETDVTDTYTPLLWSLEGNTKDKPQADERPINGVYDYAANGAPMNQGQDYNSCYNGGSWSASQEGSTVTVEISDYELNLNQLPYADGNASSGVYTYYDPRVTKNYWEVQTACFSAGEFWLVQPFYDSEENYIEDSYGPGDFSVTMTDGHMSLLSESNQNPKDFVGSIQEGETSSAQSNQMVQTDDRMVLALHLEQEGYIDQSITYQKYQTVAWNTSLTEGCWETGKDWILKGGSLNIQEIIKHNSAEGMHTGVAYDDLIKFDDAFFELESAEIGKSAGLEHMESQFLYGAKQDKRGWDHENLLPDEEGYDEEMMNMTADGLIFFSSLNELRSEGYTCVAVLWEARGLASSQSTNCYIELEGKVQETARSGYVYMVTHSGRAWNKENVKTEAASRLAKSASALTDEEYIQYAKEKFFSKVSGNTYSEYPEAFWINEPDQNQAEGLKTYEKAVYDDSGFLRGSAGRSYGDSCLVTDYAEKIEKAAAQQTGSSGGSKLSYDLDVAQRVVDYILKPSIHRTAGESVTENQETVTDLYIEDTLGKGLSYIPGSAFWGGTYIQNGEGKQGSVVGGELLEPEVLQQEDGTILLRWCLQNVTIEGDEDIYLDPVYYSCKIGTPGDELRDVKNNDQLSNQAVIWSSSQVKRDFQEADGNLAKMSIIVSKNNAISLSKTADASAIQPGDTAWYTMYIGNNGTNSINLAALDSLPYNGDAAGSRFHGSSRLAEWKIENPELMGNLSLYYTKAESERGKSSLDYLDTGISDSEIWTKLAYDAESGRVSLPDSFEPVAVAVTGTLPGGKTLKMRMALEYPEAQAGDDTVNRLTLGDLQSDAPVELEDVPGDSENPEESGTPEEAENQENPGIQDEPEKTEASEKPEEAESEKPETGIPENEPESEKTDEETPNPGENLSKGDTSDNSGSGSGSGSSSSGTGESSGEERAEKASGQTEIPENEIPENEIPGENLSKRENPSEPEETLTVLPKTGQKRHNSPLHIAGMLSAIGCLLLVLGDRSRTLFRRNRKHNR